MRIGGAMASMVVVVARDLNVLPCKTGILNGTNTHLLCIHRNTLFIGLDDRTTHKYTDVLLYPSFNNNNNKGEREKNWI